MGPESNQDIAEKKLVTSLTTKKQKKTTQHFREGEGV